jgi:hypothetical protein
MTHELLNGSDIAFMKQAGCKGVSQHVWVNWSADCGNAGGFSDSLYLTNAD